jgi:hypothetical protein
VVTVMSIDSFTYIGYVVDEEKGDSGDLATGESVYNSTDPVDSFDYQVYPITILVPIEPVEEPVYYAIGSVDEACD